MFKEYDIRPSDLQKEQLNFIQADINYLLDRQDRFVEVLCPACSNLNGQIKLQKKGFSYIECEVCSMLYMSPRPTFSILKSFYASSTNYQFFHKYIFPSSKEVRREKIFIPRVEQVLALVEKYKIEAKSLLEIGAGYGLFLEEMSKRGKFSKISGVEASDMLFQRSKELGFDVYNGVFEDLKIMQNYDVVVSFEVIEHIFDPFSVLSKIFNVLNSNSVMILTFPNYNGFDIATLMEYSDSIDHEHLNYFNENSIKLLLEKIGFKDIEVSTPGVMDVDLVRNKILNTDFQPNSFIKEICIEKYEIKGEVFQKFLIKNNLSSNMMVVARKA